MTKVFTPIFDRFRNLHSDHHAIARGMAAVALFVLLGSVARAAREMMIAYRYGVGVEVDAYVFVFNLLIWPVGIWISVLTAVLVPLAANIKQSSTPEKIRHFRAELLAFALLLGSTLMFLGWLGLPMLMRSTWIGLPIDTITVAMDMVPTLTVLIPLGVLISLFSVWTLTAGRHANTLLESVPAVVMILVLLAFPAGGIEPLVWGTLVGFFFHLVSLVVPLALRGELETPLFSRQSPEWPAFWQGFGIMLAGQTVMSFIGIIDQLFAAHLGTGAVAALGYANRILALVLGIGAMAVSRAALPVFSKIQAEDWQRLHSVANHWIRLLFLLGFCSLIVGWIFAPWAVRVLFERGAFTAANTHVVMEIFRDGLVQVPFYFSGMVLVTLLASQGQYRTIAGVGAINLITKVTANFIFVPQMGVNGVVLATAIMYMVSMSLYWLMVWRMNLKKQFTR